MPGINDKKNLVLSTIVKTNLDWAFNETIEQVCKVKMETSELCVKSVQI